MCKSCDERSRLTQLAIFVLLIFGSGFYVLLQGRPKNEEYHLSGHDASWASVIRLLLEGLLTGEPCMRAVVMCAFVLFDGDGDGFSTEHETSCNSDDGDALSVPQDTDGNGICDPLEP